MICFSFEFAKMLRNPHNLCDHCSNLLEIPGYSYRVKKGTSFVRSCQLRFSAVELVVQLQAESAPAEEPATAKTAKKTEKKEVRVVT